MTPLETKIEVRKRLIRHCRNEVNTYEQDVICEGLTELRRTKVAMAEEYRNIADALEEAVAEMVGG